MTRNETFTQDVVDFIGQYEDPDLVERMSEAMMKAALNGGENGDTRKTLCAIAKATAMLFCMWSKQTPKDRRLSASDIFGAYADVLDLYCFAYDYDRKILKEDRKEQTNTDEA